MSDWADKNLEHARRNDCTDPDCEIHHPEVGMEEGTISSTYVAFYIAGYYAGGTDALSMIEPDDILQNLVDELTSRGLISKST